jgi:hypothetical protein
VAKALDGLKAPLPAATADALRGLGKDAHPGEETATAVQKLLDPHCLVGVTINPESRVKAARGPAEAVLLRGQPSYLLIKVHNDAGVTHALTVTGPQLRGADGKGWLEAAVEKGSTEGKLSGGKVEYVILRLVAHEAGKREATLKFDAGQGTQDLGFRAEVPVLFTVRATQE